MLFHLFLTLQVLQCVSSDISCYKAPLDVNYFNYTVTVDNFPAALQNTSVDTHSPACYILVLWQRDPDHTNIGFFINPGMREVSTDQLLQVDVGYQTKTSPTPTWTKQIIYKCKTDLCNNLSVLMRLLSTLIVNESLDELAYLLNPVKPFHGEWCYRGSNATSDVCNTTVPVSSCTQCELIGTMDQAGTESCGTCSMADPGKSLLVHQKTFYITDRTNFSAWDIRCTRKNCNTPAVGDSILEKSEIYFDFSKFLRTKHDDN